MLKRGSSLGGGQQALDKILAGHATSAQPLPSHKQMCAELCQLFEGELGDELCRESAQFCCGHQQATDLLKLKRSYNFLTFLSEAERNEHLNRLGLKDLLGGCFQRVTKYPLLLNSLLNTFDPLTRTEERRLLERALAKSRAIMTEIDAVVRKEE